MSSLWSQIRDDWVMHNKDWTRPGFRALAFYRIGVWRMRIDNKLLRAPISVIYRKLYRYARNVYGIEIPYTADIGQKIIFEHQGGIIIHGNSKLGDGCIVRQGVTLGNLNLDDPHAAPTIGNYVVIGAGAKILGRIVIGDNVVIGANAVVIKDIPANHIAVGVPAVIKPR